MLYVNWTAITVNPNCKTHPNSSWYWNENWEWTFTETSYTDWTGLYIWLLDNINIPSSDFTILEKTEAEINSQLLSWYWTDWESNPFVTVSNYIFTDSRPIDII